jgi:hypothetical protein
MPRRREKKKSREKISERDLEVLGFVARFGVVPRSAVAVWARTKRSVTLDRERRLREAKLIEAHPGIAASSQLLIATRLGLRLCERPALRPARLSLWTVRHSIVVAHVAARLELAGERLLSERELGATERFEGKRIYSAERRRESRYHRPDLIRLGDESWAIEVELTNKAPRRLDELLRCWRRALRPRSELARVIYLCPPRTLRYVQRALTRIRMEDSDLIVAHPLTLPDLSLPRRASDLSGAIGAAVKGRRPDPHRGLTDVPAPLPSRAVRAAEARFER